MLIAQITDIHLGFEPDSPGEFNRQRLDRTLDRLANLDPLPAMLLLTGDLIDRGDVDSYRRLREALEGFPAPWHMALGNHDDRANFAEVFPEHTFTDGFLQYELRTGPMRLLVLDTLEVGRHGGGFCDTRAKWLTERLDEDAETPTIIVQHHPPFDSGIPWMTTVPQEPWVQRLGACLKDRDNVHTMVCGHIHRASASTWMGLEVVTTPSTAPQVALEFADIDVETPDLRPLIVADPPAYALHFWNGRELVTHWDTAEDRTILARYDDNLQSMIAHMFEERPEG
ncbi:phosphodiesterase [Croceicoccus bisphenolivorans]|uniref:phosphodiesterase n=1 Tax=Croceicoccus bisphenolivorans TaxID=1783232 RepID=UPI00082ADAE9|nr:phosphodiesterase [Croceicoccus bisphenolivorans]